MIVTENDKADIQTPILVRALAAPLDLYMVDILY